MSKVRPDFIIIGAMKSATTTLHAQLARQPGIVMSEQKEPMYFSHDDRYQRGPQWYASLFSKAKAEDICGESTTDYTKLPDYPQTVRRMREDVPDAKLIYVMRHPIERLLSHYSHEITLRKPVITSPIEKAVDLHPQLINYSRYSMQLSPYLEAFGPDRILLVFFEKLTLHPQEELTRICRFLGYTGVPVWRPEVSKQNATHKRFYSGRLKPFIESPLLSAARRYLIPKPIRSWIESRYFRYSSKPKIPTSLNKRLKDIFDKDLEVLSSWIGFPVTCDTWHEAATQRLPLLQLGNKVS